MPEEEKTIKDFEQLTGLLKKKEICKRTVVVWPEENHTQEAILQATHEGFISPILVCSDRTKKYLQIEKPCKLSLRKTLKRPPE